MSRTHTVRVALPLSLAAAAAALIASCTSDAYVVNPPVTDPIFASYVALGNSITAGYQSGGINDSTQKQAYPALLAHQMGTRYAYPSLTMPGCPPPVNNFLNQTRVGGASSTALTCLYRNPALQAPATLNNVAVPGVASIDPTASISPNGNPLTVIVLGGETMVQKALDAQPTFVTVWIGNNDVLSQALNGLPNGATAVNLPPVTPLATFVTNYAKMINQLVAGAPNVKGVLIGVVQVTVAPLMFQAGALTNPAVLAAATQVAGRPVTLDPTTCLANQANLGALVNFQYIAAIKARPAAAPGTVFCQPIAGGGVSDPGDNGILDIREQATVSALVSSYNAYIKAKADSIGFAFYDPNAATSALQTTIKAALPPFPNLASTTQPFGPYVSLDGVHPTGAAHILIANDLIGIINAKYGTHLAPTS